MGLLGLRMGVVTEPIRAIIIREGNGHGGTSRRSPLLCPHVLVAGSHDPESTMGPYSRVWRSLVARSLRMREVRGFESHYPDCGEGHWPLATILVHGSHWRKSLERFTKDPRSAVESGI